MISKNGEERRDAFRASHRKSSIEKLEDIKVNRSSKLGFTIKDLVYRLSKRILCYGTYGMDQTYLDQSYQDQTYPD